MLVGHACRSALPSLATVVSPQVAGYLTEVPVTDFQRVEEGDLLARIDDAPVAAYVPAEHVVHSVLFEALWCPASHAAQELLPLSEEMRPLGQETQ